MIWKQDDGKMGDITIIWLISMNRKTSGVEDVVFDKGHSSEFISGQQEVKL